jgi:hypothetical protein
MVMCICSLVSPVSCSIVGMLQGHHEEAFTHFERASLNRASCLGSGHVDHIVRERFCVYVSAFIPVRVFSPCCSV